jgi:uncharacterized membrane protein
MSDTLRPLPWFFAAIVVAKIAAVCSMALFGNSIIAFYFVQAGCMVPILVWFYLRETTRACTRSHVEFQGGFFAKKRTSVARTEPHGIEKIL